MRADKVWEQGFTGEGMTVAVIDSGAAVADGHKVINMSLGGAGSPADEIVKHVEKLSKEGVVFFISAGNSADEHGVGAPSLAEGAVTVGALDVNGRMADFSSYGGVYDPDRLAYRFKKIFMTPGTNIVSVSGLNRTDESHKDLNGTSMAAPHGTGAGVLLMQKILASHANLHPVRMSEKLKAAVESTEAPLDRSRMPKNLSAHQEVAVMDLWAAFRKL